jgi:methyl-accepting chemotaxis protein
VAGILGQIVAGVQKVNELIAEVSSASGEQSKGIEQINTAIAEMNRVTQNNAANAEESASASEELSAQAKGLNEMVGTLVAIVEGGRAAVADAAGSPKTTRQGNGAVLGRADSVLHRAWADTAPAGQPAGGKTVTRRASVPASSRQAIPLDDEEIKQF